MSCDYDYAALEGILYRHWKGGVYVFLSFARLEIGPDIQYVCYRNVKDGQVWVRSADDFFATIDVEGVRTRRFTMIGRQGDFTTDVT